MRLSGSGLALLLAAALPASAAAQDLDWTTALTVRPDPSPYVSDWETDPSIVTLLVSYTGGAPVTFHLEAEISGGGRTLLTGGSRAFTFDGPSQVVLTAQEAIWEGGTVTYDQGVRAQIVRTGRIPEGTYELCIDVRRGSPGAAGTVVSTACQSFTITSPAPPSLVAPFDGDSLVTDYPTFAWTPVLAGPGTGVSYLVRITPVVSDQAPIQAINNHPQHESELVTTSFAYPVDALPLEEGARYVWQVQALDDRGEPLGERQGKSEIWSFTYRAEESEEDSTESIAQEVEDEEEDAPADDEADELQPAEGNFLWDETEVEVLAVTDSSHASYSGTGKLLLMPVFPELTGIEFEFENLTLNEDGTRVVHAPTHEFDAGLIGKLTGKGANWMLDRLPLPAEMEIPRMVLFADSAADSTSVTIDGTLRLLLRPVSDGDTLVFRFEGAKVGADGPGGTLVLDEEYEEELAALPDYVLRLSKDSTWLSIAKGAGALELAGGLRIPRRTGLVPDTVVATDTTAGATARDSMLVVGVKGAVGSDGSLELAGSLPRARLGKTGLRLEAEEVGVDLEEGFSVTKGRVFLPEQWEKEEDGGEVSIDIHSLEVDAAGFDADIGGTNLENAVGGVEFVGFRGELSSARFRFVSSTLEKGTVGGAVLVPGLEGDIDYEATFTTVGFTKAHARLAMEEEDEDEDGGESGGADAAGDEEAEEPSGAVVGIPALHAKAYIQRGEFVYERPYGSFAFDARLDIEHDGIGVDGIQVYDLRFSSAGQITLSEGWLALESASESDFKGFPLAVDSIGLGGGGDGDEVWLGVAGRFKVNDNLPAAGGAFRMYARRDREDERPRWRFDRLTVSSLEMQYEDAATSFAGELAYMEDDSIYGDGFRADVELKVVDKFSAGAEFLAGSMEDYRYWYVDGKFIMPPPGIVLSPLPISIYGFGGGAYYHMRSTAGGGPDQEETGPKTVMRSGGAVVRDLPEIEPAEGLETADAEDEGDGGADPDDEIRYIPDPEIALGLKALVALGTADNQGYAWNADLIMEAGFAHTGGLRSLTFTGDNWMMTKVTQREEKIWGTVFLDFPVSQPVFHGELNFFVDRPPAFRTEGEKGAWAEIHVEPDHWYVHLGTPQEPVEFTLMPDKLDLESTAYLALEPRRIDLGFATGLKQEVEKSIFYGKVDARFSANAEMRYRPFYTRGAGELYGEIVAKVKDHTLLEGMASADMNFQLPDPTRIWGDVHLKYDLAGGWLKGTYRTHYEWPKGSAGSDPSTEELFGRLVDGAYPTNGDTDAPSTGISYYLGMSESRQYSLEEATGSDQADAWIYRLKLVGTPTLEMREPVSLADAVADVDLGDAIDIAAAEEPSARDGGRVTAGGRDLQPAFGDGADDGIDASDWSSAGTPEVDFDADRLTLTVTAPDFAPLEPGMSYRAEARFELQRRPYPSGGGGGDVDDGLCTNMKSPACIPDDLEQPTVEDPTGGYGQIGMTSPVGAPLAMGSLGGPSAGSGTRHRAVSAGSAGREMGRGSDDYETIRDTTITIVFTTHTESPELAQFVTAVRPSGSRPVHYESTAERGVRITLSNALSELGSGAVTGVLVRADHDTVSGSFESESTLRYRFRPDAPLEPNEEYRIALVPADTSGVELYSSSFRTGSYATLAEQLAESSTEVSVAEESGSGRPVRVEIRMGSAERIDWSDVDLIELIRPDVPHSSVPRSVCSISLDQQSALAGSLDPSDSCPPAKGGPRFHNVISVRFTGTSSEELPDSDTRTIALRLHHETEGTHELELDLPVDDPPTAPDKGGVIDGDGDFGGMADTGTTVDPYSGGFRTRSGVATPRVSGTGLGGIRP